MPDNFFASPILNSPYEYPSRHWELDAHGQPTGNLVESRRKADFITPIPKPSVDTSNPATDRHFKTGHHDGGLRLVIGSA